MNNIHGTKDQLVCNSASFVSGIDALCWTTLFLIYILFTSSNLQFNMILVNWTFYILMILNSRVLLIYCSIWKSMRSNNGKNSLNKYKSLFSIRHLARQKNALFHCTMMRPSFEKVLDFSSEFRWKRKTNFTTMMWSWLRKIQAIWILNGCWTISYHKYWKNLCFKQSDRGCTCYHERI